jgi:hypothetical protein
VCWLSFCHFGILARKSCLFWWKFDTPKSQVLPTKLKYPLSRQKPVTNTMLVTLNVVIWGWIQRLFVSSMTIVIIIPRPLFVIHLRVQLLSVQNIDKNSKMTFSQLAKVLRRFLSSLYSARTTKTLYTGVSVSELFGYRDPSVFIFCFKKICDLCTLGSRYRWVSKYYSTN